LNLPSRKTSIVPLGSEILGSEDYDYHSLHLIYIGNFNWRRLTDTIDGFFLFYEQFSGELELSYTIIGYGNQTEIDQIKDRIKKYRLGDVIHFPGIVPYDKLSTYIEQCNIGVSYIPITNEFDIQPPTKTIEYLLAGLPTIATATSENQKLINAENGVLIQDTVSGFYEGLCKIKESSYDNDLIRQKMVDFTWKNRVHKFLKPVIDRIVAPG
jgi:glycosyltransferase involved in cell wall biosynthesis